MTREEKVKAFRALHERPGIFVIPNPWNAGSAMILAALGFEALATTSAGFAFNAGLRDDAEDLTREGVIANAREIVDAVNLPVSADMQNGFGDSPADCAATVRAGALVGLAGGSIEDAGEGSRGSGENPIYDIGLAVERVSAAAQAARECGFVLTARAENFLYGRNDLNDTIRRLQAFAQAGADVLYAPGLTTLDEIRAVCSAVDKPVNVLMGIKGTVFSVEELASAGAKRISVGGALARAALGGFVRAAREIREQGTFTFTEEAIQGSDVAAMIAKVRR